MGIFRDVNEANAGQGAVALGEGSLQPPSERHPGETPPTTTECLKQVTAARHGLSSAFIPNTLSRGRGDIQAMRIFAQGSSGFSESLQRLPVENSRSI